VTQGGAGLPHALGALDGDGWKRSQQLVYLAVDDARERVSRRRGLG
jgi:hypothetical protein